MNTRMVGNSTTTTMTNASTLSASNPPREGPAGDVSGGGLETGGSTN